MNGDHTACGPPESEDEDMLSAEASDEDITDGVALGIEEAEEAQQRNSCVSVVDANDGGGMSAVDTRDDYDSDSSLEYEYDGPASGPCVKETYQSFGFYDTEDVAEQYLHRLNQYVYTYKTKYLSTFRVGRRKRYQVCQKGQHTGETVNLTPKGISPIIKPEVDALLKLGVSAGRVRNMLLFKYLRDPNMLALVPETKKMENRKAYLKRQAGEGWEINNFITLRNWTCTKLCQTHAEFVGVDPDNVADTNDLIVLDEFEHLVTVNLAAVASLGIIFTSRALFRNVQHAGRDQGDNLVLSTDGTYRIHFGGWTLVDCGGISVERSGAGYVQRFRPWLYMFVRTECTPAYEHMFNALVKYASTSWGVKVEVRSASIDHADAITSALESVWPHIEILTCWEHLLRQHLRLLHQSRSLKQFRALSKRVVNAWETAGETQLAEWLEHIYLSKRWERWSVNGSSVPGFLPTQQPIESHHHVIKVIVTDYKNAPTVMVFNSVWPRGLLYDAINLTSEHHHHYAEGEANRIASFNFFANI
ncbi:unnamed protein product [Phytophthora fragariaefolia]|uniref:Unnamed protein product n=1 Tax=Phytophthora fragariaefolia TaxID=1490495 RepID=A0A9W7CXU0_9STRA|nr:unnamed protein product [Phytophthora fragariaefolia]